MNKKILAVFALGGLVVGLCSQVLGQAVLITPTLDNPLLADAIGGGANQGVAMVQQTVHLKLPQATALHLAVTDLTFDMDTLGKANDPYAGKRVCVYGKLDTKPGVKPGDPPIVTENVSDKPGALGAMKPLGTQYRFSGAWPNIEVDPDTHGGFVESYPPIRFTTGDKKLIPGSKNHFVCYSSFILQKFSNGSQWKLTVERLDDLGPGHINDLYIQDNPCHQAGGLELMKIGKAGTTVNLLSQSTVTGGTTGSHVRNLIENGDTTCGTKSWLDDLVILAVKVDGEGSGDNIAKLKYTLTTTKFPDYVLGVATNL
jgi:hypothetical protein